MKIILNIIFVLFMFVTLGTVCLYISGETLRYSFFYSLITVSSSVLFMLLVYGGVIK